MDYYSLDKRCPSLLSAPVISSTSCLAEGGGANGTNVCINGGANAYRSNTDNCLSGSHSYGGGHGNGVRHEDTSKMASANNGDMFTDGDYSLPSYYNLDSHNQQPHRVQQQSHFDEMKNKSHISYHHIPPAPVYANISCTIKVDNNQSSMYSGKEYDLYPMQQCPPQSTTSPIMNIPDSPSIVSPNTTYHHTVSGRHQTSPETQQRNMCVAKKSTTNPNCYELKREMAESSGLSLSGTPFYKSRSGRKGF